MSDLTEAQRAQINEFHSVTGINDERAEFFLKASAWDTQVAIATYFENERDLEEPPAPSHVPAPSPIDSTSTSSRSQPPYTAPEPSHRRTGIQTFASSGVSRQPEEDDDDDQGQAYYAGGSDTSGQQILGPPRKGLSKDSKGMVKNLFDAARQHGAEEVPSSDRPEKSQRSHFVGTGYRLGESESETSQAVAGMTKKKETVAVKLKMWSKGFTVNDGPLRAFDEPDNRQFLDSIHRGQIPQELLVMANGGQVALDMEDHSSEDYVPPKQPKVRAFAGAGQTLGSQPQASTSTTVSSGSATQITVDTSLPVTNIQIRLADGSRLVAKFNHSHTVGDIRRHIVASRPQYSGVAFSLITTLPSRQLTDDSITIKEADLMNAAIMQKL